MSRQCRTWAFLFWLCSEVCKILALWCDTLKSCEISGIFIKFFSNMFPLSKLKKKKGKGCEGVKWSETKLSESILHPLCAVDQRCPPTDTLADKKPIAKVGCIRNGCRNVCPCRNWVSRMYKSHLLGVWERWIQHVVILCAAFTAAFSWYWGHVSFLVPYIFLATDLV